MSGLLHSRIGGATRAGFTLIELLVVVSIIGLLISILLPALGKARGNAKLMQEMAAARQLTFGLNNYADAHKNNWLRAVDVDPLGKMKVYTATGRELTGAAAFPEGEPRMRWANRLAPYVSNSYRGVMYVDRSISYLPGGQKYKAVGTSLGDYLMPLYTSFGLNAQGVGGIGYGTVGLSSVAWTRIEIVKRPGVESCLPSRLMAFASSDNYAGGTDGVDGTAYTMGWMVITPPNPSTAGATAWPSTPWNFPQVNEFGSVALRHEGRAVAGFVDGHAEARNEAAMRDMRVWLRTAEQNDDPNYVSPY